MINEWFEELYQRGTIDDIARAELYRIARGLQRPKDFAATPFSTYRITCRDIEGNLLWTRTAGNLCTTQGTTWLLNNALTGVNVYLGLVVGASVPTFVIGDTMASHAGWSEILSGQVVNSTRPQIVWGTASGGVVNNSASLISYTISPSLVGTVTLQGAFISDNNSIGGTSGNLIFEALFDQGAAPVAASNNVTVQANVTILAG